MLEEIIIGLLIITIILISFSLYLNHQRGLQISDLPQTEPLSFEDTQNAIKILTNEDVTNALNASLTKQGISEKIGAFTELSEDMEEAIKQFNQMVASKSQRAGWGEWQLDEELSAAFPEVNIRKKVKELGNLIPDAHIRTPDGKILIVDSKFVYSTYEQILNTPETRTATIEGLRKTFRNDVETHVTKIKNDYVQPGKGTHEFAFMYIPSTAVYEFLVDKEPGLVRRAASQGVVISSPMTLMANMHMLEIVRMALNMTNKHNEILDAHLRIQKIYKDFEQLYSTLKEHIKKANKKTVEVTGKVNEMSAEINSLSSLDESIEESSDD
jgi:DNA recombination protein RmuC|tara:strand:+ start:78 stop:1058 length:981 start_codon:yes stop_codon:yes gene_type:complete